MSIPQPRDIGVTDLCRTATELVEDYYNRIGGRDFVHDEAAKELEKLKAGPPRKRGRASTSSAAAPKGKKVKADKHPANTTPPASLKDFKPPTGSWEDEIKAIDGVEERADGNMVVYVTWRSGHKTEHPLERVYRRCPQKVGSLRWLTAEDGLLTTV
jgi:chromobox protein 1